MSGLTIETVPERRVAFHRGRVRFSITAHERFFDAWERRLASFLAGHDHPASFFARVYHSDTELEVWTPAPSPVSTTGRIRVRQMKQELVATLTIRPDDPQGWPTFAALLARSGYRSRDVPRVERDVGTDAVVRLVQPVEPNSQARDP